MIATARQPSKVGRYPVLDLPAKLVCLSTGAKGGTRTPRFPRQILSLVRLPIPPLSHLYFQLITSLCCL